MSDNVVQLRTKSERFLDRTALIVDRVFFKRPVLGMVTFVVLAIALGVLATYVQKTFHLEKDVVLAPPYAASNLAFLAPIDSATSREYDIAVELGARYPVEEYETAATRAAYICDSWEKTTEGLDSKLSSPCIRAREIREDIQRSHGFSM